MSNVKKFRIEPPPPRPQESREFLAECSQSYHNLSVQGAAMHLGDVMTDLWEKHDFTPAEAATVVAAFTSSRRGVVAFQSR